MLGNNLLIVIELLLGLLAYGPFLYTNVCLVVLFVLDYPQPNQVCNRYRHILNWQCASFCSEHYVFF